MLEEKKALVSRIESKIIKKWGIYESCQDPFFKDVVKEDIQGLRKLREAIINGSVKQLLHDDHYGPIWEEWMVVRGMADDV